MSIIRWNPWNMDRMLEDDWEFPTIPGISKLMGQGLNIYETSDALVAQAALPGISKEKIDITVDDGIVRITGSSKENEDEKGKRRYFMSSLATSYNYSFRIPEGVVENLEPVAEIDNGILKLIFKKAEKKEPKKISITSKAKTS